MDGTPPERTRRRFRPLTSEGRFKDEQIAGLTTQRDALRDGWARLDAQLAGANRRARKSWVCAVVAMPVGVVVGWFL